MIKSYKDYLEKARKRAKEYYEAHKNDPEFKEKRRLREKARREKLKQTTA